MNIEERLYAILDSVHQTTRADASQPQRLRWALAQLHGLLAAYPIRPDMAGTVAFYQGYLYDELGEPEHALPFYQEALRSPTPLRSYGPDGLNEEHRPPGYAAYRLGLAYLAVARPLDAVAALRLAVSQGIGGANEVSAMCAKLEERVRSSARNGQHQQPLVDRVHS